MFIGLHLLYTFPFSCLPVHAHSSQINVHQVKLIFTSGGWFWVNGDNSMNATFDGSMWREHEPDNKDDNENVGCFGDENGMTDETRDSPNDHICEIVASGVGSDKVAPVLIIFTVFIMGILK